MSNEPKPPYAIQLDFDAVGDPPAVYLVDATGMRVAEMYDEPVIKPDATDTFINHDGEETTEDIAWSSRSDDWQISARTRALLDAMNRIH